MAGSEHPVGAMLMAAGIILVIVGLLAWSGVLGWFGHLGYARSPVFV